MDKQKQIEEMAKILLEMSCKGSECENCAFIRSVKEAEETCVCLKALYNAGYRKISENAVVLTGTETEERLVDLLVDFDEMTFFPLTLCPNPEEYTKEWKQKLIYAIGQLRKEMAEKFAEKLKEKLCEFLEDNEDYNGKIDKGVCLIDVIGVTALDGEIISLGLIDEICKEMVEGK